jgi:hypothetical protein
MRVTQFDSIVIDALFRKKVKKSTAHNYNSVFCVICKKKNSENSTDFSLCIGYKYSFVKWESYFHLMFWSTPQVSTLSALTPIFPYF